MPNWQILNNLIVRISLTIVNFVQIYLAFFQTFCKNPAVTENEGDYISLNAIEEIILFVANYFKKAKWQPYCVEW